MIPCGKNRCLTGRFLKHSSCSCPGCIGMINRLCKHAFGSVGGIIVFWNDFLSTAFVLMQVYLRVLSVYYSQLVHVLPCLLPMLVFQCHASLFVYVQLWATVLSFPWFVLYSEQFERHRCIATKARGEMYVINWNRSMSNAVLIKDDFSALLFASLRGLRPWWGTAQHVNLSSISVNWGGGIVAIVVGGCGMFSHRKKKKISFVLLKFFITSLLLWL